jgi:hypothetical protein
MRKHCRVLGVVWRVDEQSIADNAARAFGSQLHLDPAIGTHGGGADTTRFVGASAQEC